MMEKQMELFARGGLKDEGGMVDEESGNRVPIGGTREGVRDDIEANVSEGEFILSEDVTRYHGLEKLMNLRQEAKMGLKRMEAMGQMGNSDEATMPDDLPFGMDDLIIVASGEPDNDSGELNMAVGGLTTGTTNVVRTGQDVPPAQGQPVAPTTTATRRLTPEITQPVRTTIDFKKLMGEAAIEYKEYRNAAGNNIMIPFIGGVATFPIPDGYFLYTGEGSVGTGNTPTDDIVADTNAATQEIRSRDSGDRTNVAVQPKPVDYDNISNEELLKLAQDQTGTKGTLVKVAMGFMGPLGIFGMLAMSHQSKKILSTINSRIASGIIGNDLKGEFTEVLGLLEKGTGGLVGGVVDFIGGLLGKTPEEIKAVKNTTAEIDKKTNPDQPLFKVNPRSGVTELTISVPEAVQSVLKDVPATATDQQMTEMLTSKVIGNVTEGERQALADAAFAPSGGENIAEFDLAREAMAEVAPVGAVDALAGTPLTTYRDMSPQAQADRASTVSVAGADAQLPLRTTPDPYTLASTEKDRFITTPVVDTSTYTAPSVTGITPPKDVAPAVDTTVYTAPSAMKVPASPTGYAAYDQADFLKDAGVPTVPSTVEDIQGYAGYSQADFLKEAGISPSLATQTKSAFTGVNNKDAALRSADIEKDSIGEFELKIGQPVTDIEGLMPPKVDTKPTYTAADYMLPTSTGMKPPKPVVDTSTYTQPSSIATDTTPKVVGGGRGDGAFEVAKRQADSSTITTPDQYTLASTESDRFTPSIDITTTPKMRPSGLGAKPVETSTPTQTYKAGDSNQATAWMNLPDANLAQAADLNKRYATTGGTAVDGYAVGAITDGKSQGVYADKEGFALRDAEDRVVYRNDDFDVPVVKSTVYERVFEGADKYKPATKFDASKTSTASTNKETAVTPAKKNQLSKTAKAKIGTDASGGDPNMAGAVWTSQPGTNVLTRTFPKKDDKKPAPVTTTKKSSSGGGGGSSSGGGSSKIVCTAMNESYGFGSYRQAVWLKYSNNNLTKEHEVGYHTLFLPLVELAYQKDYKYVRKTLENIARHRTADLRAEMQNKKRDKLGRFYRAILEPICYLVGAYKMFRNK